MCYKIIQYAEYSCSHQTVTRQQVVDCRKRDCRFSPSHQTGMHTCGSTCSQMSVSCLTTLTANSRPPECFLIKD
ncbi:hypothetical protein EV702DRAFT_1075701 [Suillus placidus]|uniref:Uncharacterized protein n=1 Tax=Suillus placidus TaxID=48579 RepID=A0A9P7A1M9_9AGAM|nr:hypothetical protein EV702DRAFT_1075701 [Suillus placidus]